ncbi:MAG TPA: hypothetical protein VIJ31_12175 [Acidothermaceae bacterium]
MAITWDNGFDLGTDGATVTTSSIASSGSAYTKTGTGTATFTAANAIDGARAIQLVRASTSLSINTNFAINTADISWSEFFTYLGNVPNAPDYLFDTRTGPSASSTSLVRLLCTASTGIPFLQILGTTVWTSGTALTAGTQYRVDFRVHVSATVGTVNVDFYTPYGSSPLFTGAALTSQNTGTANITDVRCGPSGNNTVTVGTFVLDRVRGDVSQSSSYLGAPTSGHTGSASLVSTATLGTAGFVGHAAAATLVSTATLNASPTGTGTGVTYNDTRYTYSSLLVTYAGVTSAPTVSLLAPATLSAVNIDAAIVIPVPGIWRTTISKPYSALITITVGT